MPGRLSRRSKKHEDKIAQRLAEWKNYLDGIWVAALAEFDLAYVRWLVDIVTDMSALYSRFWGALFNSNLLDFGNGLGRLAIEVLDDIGNHTIDFFQRVAAIPVRILSREAILKYFPVPVWSEQRVMVTADCFRMVAQEMVDCALDVSSSAIYPDFMMERAKAGIYWERMYLLWHGAGEMLEKLVKSSLKSTALRIGFLILSIFGGIMVLAMVWAWAGKVMTMEEQERTRFKSLTQKNPIVWRKQKHKVRDNPKLKNR